VTVDRRPLETFWRRLERLRVEDMLARSARPTDEASHGRALAAAREAASRDGVAGAIRAATADIDDWVVRLFNRSTVQPGWMEANWGRPGSVADRANLAASLGEAVTALLLAERLPDHDRDELLGAWADLATQA
jgi:hypothetical protein